MDFIRRRIEPCAGAPVHILACGHTVSASSFVHSTKSSKCAPNCKSVDLITAAEPWFLCPTCYESAVQAQFDRFKSRFLHPSETGERVESDSRIQSNRKKGFERKGWFRSVACGPIWALICSKDGQGDVQVQSGK